MSEPGYVGEWFCPWCGVQYDAEEDDIWAVDEIELCQNCNKKYVLTCTVITAEFETREVGETSCLDNKGARLRRRIIYPMTDAYYHEPVADKPCSQCRFRRYDSFHNEMWCGHQPPPELIGEQALIGPWGHCEYWESDKPRSW